MEALQVAGGLTIPPDELSVSFVRSGGPGGQNVNKLSTRVELRYSVAESRVLDAAQRARLLERLAPRLTAEGVLIVRSSRTRHRARNLEDARERLAALLRAALVRSPRRVATRPTRASQRRRLDQKRQRGDVKRERRRPLE